MSSDFYQPDSPTTVEPHRGTLILVLGILSLLLCAPIGIAAWIMGSSDLAAMRQGRMDRSGESITRVGQVLGIVATVLMAIGVAFFFLGIVVTVMNAQ